MLIFPGLRRENVNIQENLWLTDKLLKNKKTIEKKTKRNINSKVGGKTFNYTGRKREKKEKCSNNKIGNVNCHEMVSATTSQIHQQLTDTSPLFGM